MNEFDIIERYFNRPLTGATASHVLHGIGDDAAVLNIPVGQQLVTSVDTLVAGVHFLESTPAQDIGYKSLAVSLSDLAAMGAKPAWVLLSLTLPRVDAQWLYAFANGFFELIDKLGLQLVGGDTTRGPLAISCQVMGFTDNSNNLSTKHSQALLRRGAQVGDAIFVIGHLGGAGLALNLLTQVGVQPTQPLPVKDKETLFSCLHRPVPQLDAGLALRGLATAAVDISDGLLADLGHIVAQSGVGAHIFQDLLPIHPVVKKYLPLDSATELAVTAGDDYALCCTVPPTQRHALLSALDALGCPYRYIGTITQARGVSVYDAMARQLEFTQQGYTHNW